MKALTLWSALIKPSSVNQDLPDVEDRMSLIVSVILQPDNVRMRPTAEERELRMYRDRVMSTSSIVK